MTTNDAFNDRLAAWLHEDSEHRVAAHLDEVLVVTAATPQRPWWSSPERWLPMDLTTRANALAFPRMGRLLLVGLLILAIVGLAIIAVGAQQKRLPPPFGVARNGAILYWDRGDIYSADADGSNAHVVVGGRTSDLAPWHSRDGTQFVFWREPSAGQDQLMIANADGGDVRQLTDTLVHADWFEWSPRDDQIAVVYNGPGKRVLAIVDPTGQTPIRTLDIPFSVDNDVYWLPPDGAELVFSGRPDQDKWSNDGLYAIRPDGTGLRTIVSPTPAEHPYWDLALPADGKSILYATVDSDGSNNGIGWHIHRRDLATGADQSITFDPTSTDEHGPVFSPDGTKVLLWTETRTLGVEAGESHLVLAPADGSSPGRILGATFPTGTPLGYAFSPDGSTAILSYTNGVTQFFDVGTGQLRATADGIANYASWQRLAP